MPPVSVTVEHVMQKANFRNILQMVILSAPPVLMALAGLLLRGRPPQSGLAEKPEQAERKNCGEHGSIQSGDEAPR
jgi:hypothetical protein